MSAGPDDFGGSDHDSGFETGWERQMRENQASKPEVGQSSVAATCMDGIKEPAPAAAQPKSHPDADGGPSSGLDADDAYAETTARAHEGLSPEAAADIAATYTPLQLVAVIERLVRERHQLLDSDARCAEERHRCAVTVSALGHEAYFQLAELDPRVEPLQYALLSERARAMENATAVLCRADPPASEAAIRADERARCLQTARTGVAWHLIRDDDVPGARGAIELAIERMGPLPHSTTLFALYRACVLYTIGDPRRAARRLERIESAAKVLDEANSDHFALLCESTEQPIGCLTAPGLCSTDAAELVVHALMEDQCELVEVKGGRAACPVCKGDG